MSAKLFYLPLQTATLSSLAEPGAKLYFYQTGTTTPITVYADASLTVALTSPVVANGAGRFSSIYLDDTKTYRLVVKTHDDIPIDDIDPYTPGNLVSPTAANVNYSPAGIGAVARTMQDKLRETLSLCDFGAITTDQTAMTAILQAAVNAAAASGQTLYLPCSSGTVRVNGTIIIPDGGIDIVGDGTIYSTVDAPLFKLTGGSFYHKYSDFEVIFELGVGVMPTAACAIELASPSGTNYIQRNTFSNIRTIGAIATIVSSSATYTTSFGQESTVDWNTFDNISNLERLGGESRNVIWFKTGSGTGNTYSAIKGQLGAAASAFFRFDGSGCVVGDIIVPFPQTSAGTGGTVDCAVLEVGPNTLYRSNIQILGGQADSRLTRVFRLSSVGIAAAPYFNINHDACLVGGATVLGIDVPLTTMRINDRDGGVWRGGGYWSTSATGAQTIPVCKVTMGAVFGGIRLTLITTGLVGGVAGGNNKTDISLTCDGATITATVVSNSPSPAGLFNVSFTGSGLVKTINITFTPTGSPSKGNVTWEAVGNNFFLERLI